MKKDIAHTSIDDPLLGLKIVEFNPTDLCNRTCSFCPRADPAVYPNRNVHMSVDTVATAIEDLVQHNYKGKIVFSGWGEPTLNREITKLIALASQHFVTHLVTNGDKIIDDEWYTLDDFVKAGLDEMFIDAYDDEQQYQAWLNKIEPYKGVMKFKVSPKYEKAHPITLFVNRAGMVSHPEIQEQGNNFKCLTPSVKAFIDWDGSLLLCCHDWSRSVSFGNVNEHPLSVLWTSERMMTIRKALFEQSRQASGKPCSQCNAAGNQHDYPILNEIWPKKFAVL